MNSSASLPRSGDRVRRHTDPAVNQLIDIRTRAAVERYRQEPRGAIVQRLRDLDREWDIERYLETNASTLALTGLVLGATVNRKWLLLSGTVLGFLWLHAVQGWCPPLPILRAAGIRTRGEIATEQHLLQELLRARQETMPTLRETRREEPAPTTGEFAAALRRAYPDISPLA